MQQYDQRRGAASDYVSPAFGGPAPGRSTLVDAQDYGDAPAPAGPHVELPDPELSPETVPANSPAQATPAAPPPVALTAAQIADAIAFHTQQPWKYTKKVITDIQTGVGATATGRMDAATVQKIAERQAQTNAERKPTPPLKVDGKAGPRTLPIVCPVGLATDAAIDKYTADVKGMKPALDKATDPAARAALLLKELNERLAAVGVPPITKPVVITPDVNQFEADKWLMSISAKTLADPSFAASIMYHEARHAEQAFRIARMLAGKHKSDAQIVAEAPLEPSLVAAAKAAPIAPGSTEAAEAEGWHDPEIGAAPGRSQREKLLAFQVTAKAFAASPTPENHQRASDAYDAWKAAYIASYRDKPDEFDGFFLGDKVADKLGTPRRDDFLPLDDAIQVLAKADTPKP